jgi:anti-anti-sigma factor
MSSELSNGCDHRCPVCASELKSEPLAPAKSVPCARCGHLVWFGYERLGDDEEVIKFRGKLIHSEQWTGLLNSLKLRPGGRLVLDFHDVDFIASGIFSKLIELKRKVRAVTGSLILRHVNAQIFKQFQVTRLDHMSEFEDRSP